MMVLTDTHKECNRQDGLNFLGVRPVLDLVASEEKFRGLGVIHPTATRYHICALQPTGIWDGRL